MREVSIQCTGIIGDDQLINVTLIGSSFTKTIEAEYNYDDVMLIVPVPVIWGVNEVAQVSIAVGGVEKKIDGTISFTDEQVDGPLQIDYLSDSAVQVAWPDVTINETTTLIVNEFSYNGLLRSFSMNHPETSNLSDSQLLLKTLKIEYKNSILFVRNRLNLK